MLKTGWQGVIIAYANAPSIVHLTKHCCRVRPGPKSAYMALFGLALLVLMSSVDALLLVF